MIDAEAKLALVEFLLSSVDASVCAQRGLEWLGRHAACRAKRFWPPPRAIPIDSWGIAALGISPARTGEFVLDLEDRAQSAGRGRLERTARALPSGPAPARNAARRRAVSRRAASARQHLPPLGILLARRATSRARRRCALVRGDPRRKVPGAAACATSPPIPAWTASGICSTASSTRSPIRSC